jgi:hypothetical protein
LGSYIEWEKYPERKRVAQELLKTKKFTPIPGQLEQMSYNQDSNPHCFRRVPVRPVAHDEPDPRRPSMEGVP